MKDTLTNNKKNILKGCLAFILLIVMFIVIFTMSERRQENVLGETFQPGLDFETTSITEVINHNFKLPTVEKSNVRALTTDNDNSAKESDKELSSGQGDKNLTQTEGITMTANTLVIPKLNINTKVIEGIDGEEAIHEGAWLYPSSYEDDGEKILLGHRRFWGADDPRSFWNLDHLQDGDMIHYADAKGKVYNYKVKAVSVRNAEDHAILKASKENMIKVISCSTADGSAGSAEKRIVVIATQV